MQAGDERPTRLRALFDRIAALPDDVLGGVERAVAEAVQPCNPHLWRGSVCSDGSSDMTCSRCGERVVTGPRDDPSIAIFHVAEAFRAMPSARRDLDRMADAIHALPEAHVSGPGDRSGEVSRPIIGFTGLAGSGKSTAADHLVEAHGFVRVKFAGPLKAMLVALGLGPDEIEGNLKEVPSDLLCGRTPRRAMQTLGFEWGRELMGPDIWARACGKAADVALADGVPGIVADDVRFLNEVTAIHERGGYVMRVARDGAGSASGAAHASEAGGMPFDAILTNDGDIDDLHATLDAVMDAMLVRRAA